MAQKKPKQGAEYVLSPHLGLLMPITNSVKAGKNAHKKPKTDSSILGSIYSLHRTQLRSCVFNCVIKNATLFMMVFSFLFVVLTLPRISLLVNAFLKIIEKIRTVKDGLAKKSLDLL